MMTKVNRMVGVLSVVGLVVTIALFAGRGMSNKVEAFEGRVDAKMEGTENRIDSVEKAHIALKADMKAVKETVTDISTNQQVFFQKLEPLLKSMERHIIEEDVRNGER